MKFFFYIHGTTGFTQLDAHISRFFAGKLLPDEFTTGITPKLIPVNNAPRVATYFSDIYQTCDQALYYQWSGKLGASAWNEASAAFLNLLDSFSADQQPTEVVFVTHSHGAHVARLIAEHWQQQQKNIDVKVISIAAPLSVKPLVTMPENVSLWLGAYHYLDGTQAIGTRLMQGTQSMTLRRNPADLIPFCQPDTAGTRNWHGMRFTFRAINPHDALTKKIHAKRICDEAKKHLGITASTDHTASTTTTTCTPARLERR